MQMINPDKGCELMIVDDSPFMRIVLRTILELIGYKVIDEAQNGYEAVEKYNKLKPDVTIMDVAMPKKNGVEATAEILTIDEKAKVVMCSSMVEEALVDTALNIGAKGVIYKPYKTDQIKDVIDKVMQT